MVEDDGRGLVVAIGSGTAGAAGRCFAVAADAENELACGEAGEGFGHGSVSLWRSDERSDGCGRAGGLQFRDGSGRGGCEGAALAERAEAEAAVEDVAHQPGRGEAAFAGHGFGGDHGGVEKIEGVVEAEAYADEMREAVVAAYPGRENFRKRSSARSMTGSGTSRR